MTTTTTNRVITTTPITNKKRGRKTVHYETSWGETVVGLYRKPNTNIYRIREIGKEYTESDERLAVAKFKQWANKQTEELYRIAVPTSELSKKDVAWGESGVGIEGSYDGNDSFFMDVPPSLLWAWLRKNLLERPNWIADKVGIPQLTTLADFNIPIASIRLDLIAKEYLLHSESTPLCKRKALQAFNVFKDYLGVNTLSDLMTENLLKYNDHIKKKYQSADTVKSHFGKVKTVIAFGLKRGLNATEIRGALDRMKILTNPKTKKDYKPNPISREDFNALLSKADEKWKAALLLSLNCCLYPSELLAVQWEDIDLNKQTFLSKRNKTGVIRVAVLWEETIAALKALGGGKGAIFKSAVGLAYHPNSWGKLYRRLRKEAGVKAEYNNLRDGAYTAACSQGVEFHLVQILAGHKASGQADHYIARNPSMVKTATDAVYKAYFWNFRD